MLESNSPVITNDLNTMFKDAKALLHAATTLTGEKAEAVRKRGMRMLNFAQMKEREIQERATSKHLVVLDEGDVLENIGFAIISAVGFGILAGLILSMNN